jgi:hypothetical protein
MGYTRTIRFIEPVDPRRVWSYVLAAIGAGDDYPVERYAPGRPITELFGGPNGCWRGTASAGGYHTDTVLAVPTMYYGADGGPLVDDVDDYPPPAGFVDVRFDVSNSRADDARIAAECLALLVDVAAIWCDDYTGYWHAVDRAAR